MSERSSNGEFILYYHGSLSPSSLPLSLVEAVALLPRCVKVRIRAYTTQGQSGYRNQLVDLARRLGVEDRLEFVAPLRREALLPACARADLGLSLMPTEASNPNERSMVGASNKTFDYFACGFPALVSDLPDWNETFAKPGYAVACVPESPESIVSAIQPLLEARATTLQMGERARQRILSEWNYEYQFREVLQLLES